LTAFVSASPEEPIITLRVTPFSVGPLAAAVPPPAAAVPPPAAAVPPASVFAATVFEAPVFALVADVELELLPQAEKASSDPVSPSAVTARREVLFTWVFSFVVTTKPP